MTGVPVTWAAPQSDEWLTERGNGIGGSDIAALLGVDPYRTPMQLWLDKTGRGDPFTGNYATDRGHHMEAFLLDIYGQQHPGTIIDTAPDDMPSIIAHPDVPAARVSLDGIAHNKHSSYLLEVKTAGHRQVAKWADGAIPDAYQVQVGYQLAVTGLDHAVIVADVAGEYHERTVHADANFTAAVLAEVADWWWDHIHPDGPHKTPPPDPARDRDLLARVWTPNLDAEPVVIDADLAQRLRDTKAAANAAQTHYELTAAEVQAAMADAVDAIDPTGSKVATWRPTKAAERIDAKRLRAEFPDVAAAVTLVGKPGRTFRPNL